MRHPPDDKFQLSETERSLISLCMEIARDKFRANAVECVNMKTGQATRLSRQFHEQTEAADRLRLRLDSAVDITIGKVEEA